MEPGTAAVDMMKTCSCVRQVCVMLITLYDIELLIILKSQAKRPPVEETTMFLYSLLKSHGRNSLESLFGPKARNDLELLGGPENVALALSGKYEFDFTFIKGIFQKHGLLLTLHGPFI